MSESIEMCKIVRFHGCQRPKFRMHPAPEVHDFAMRCMNFLSHFEHLICHIKHGADILSRRMFLGNLHPISASNHSLNSDTGFMWDSSPNIYKEARKLTVPYSNTAPILCPLIT